VLTEGENEVVNEVGLDDVVGVVEEVGGVIEDDEEVGGGVEEDEEVSGGGEVVVFPVEVVGITIGVDDEDVVIGVDELSAN
jgi:hypothetical protein